MKAYSQDLRERVVRACDTQHGTRQQIADLFGVSTAWIRRLLQRRRETGSFAAKPHAGGAIKMTQEHCDRLTVLVAEQPDATLAELHERLAAPVHPSTLACTLLRLRLTVKKKVRRAAEQDRPDVRHQRAIFRGRAAGVDPDRFVFLDETSLNTAMTRRYGRAPRGQRLVESVPQGQWQTTTLLSAIRRDGVVGSLEFSGATDTLTFRAYLDQVLVPALRAGDIVVLDNLAVHRVGAVARVLRKAGVGVWYLPPYSPDFNPIEKIWAKVKALVRQAKVRTTEALWEVIAKALQAVTPQDCQGCFAFCGYHATPECKML